MVDNIYEVYAYLDPRHPGSFIYGEYEFHFKPVYIGKGNALHKRKLKHLRKSSNRRLNNLITHLRGLELLPIIITLHQDLIHDDAIKKEIEIIKLIGRNDIKQGPLFNFCNGGEGVPGIVINDEQKLKRSQYFTRYFANLTDEQRKLHGYKSLIGRTPEGELSKKIKFKAFRDSLTIEQKTEMERKRFEGWCESFYNHTAEQKEQQSTRCSVASSRKRQHYVTLKNLDTNITESKFLIEWTSLGLAKDGIMDRIRKHDFVTPVKSRTIQMNFLVVDAVKRKPTEDEHARLLHIR